MFDGLFLSLGDIAMNTVASIAPAKLVSFLAPSEPVTLDNGVTEVRSADYPDIIIYSTDLESFRNPEGREALKQLCLIAHHGLLAVMNCDIAESEALVALTESDIGLDPECLNLQWFIQSNVGLRLATGEYVYIHTRPHGDGTMETSYVKGESMEACLASIGSAPVEYLTEEENRDFFFNVAGETKDKIMGRYVDALTSAKSDKS